MNYEEAQAAIGQVESGAMTYRELKQLAELIGCDLPAKTTRQEQSEILLAALRTISGEVPVDDQIDRAAETDKRDAELILDEDLDIVSVYHKSGEKPALARRLGGLRGAAAKKIVRDVEQLADADGYVVRRKLRRISGVDYGM